MIKYKTLGTAYDNQCGISLIFLWLFSITMSYNIVKGDHMTLGFSAGPFEVSMGLSIWRKLLP
tara:strand:+ start:105 stop:293 length:189 start_codon:yes stop_codon:yes gene_type:complete